MHENPQRIFLRNPLIPLVTILFGSVWFGLSILAYVIGFFLPHTHDPLPSLPPPRRSNGTTARSPGRPAAVAPLPSILASKKDPPQHHVRFPHTVPQPSLHRPRATKRWSSPAGFDSIPPPPSREQDPEPAIEEAQSQSDANGSRVAPLCVNRLLSSLSHLDSDSQTSCSPVSSTHEDVPEPSLSRNSSTSFVRKTSLSKKLPTMNVFRSRSRRVKSDGGHSRSGSISSSVASTPPSTPPAFMLELKSDTEKGSTSTFSSSDQTPSRSGIAQAFKFRPKRASASATMSVSADRSSVLVSEAIRVVQQTPSPPPSPDRETPGATPSAGRSRSQTRRKAFASYLNLSVHTPQDPVTSSTASPRTAALDGGFQSASTRSIFSPATPKPFCPKKVAQPSTPSGPVARTQPYGYPYFAMMPNGEYAAVDAMGPPPELSARRRSFGGSLPHSRSNSMDDGLEKEADERLETLETATPANTLGLEFGLLDSTITTPRGPSRHRHTASVS